MAGRKVVIDTSIFIDFLRSKAKNKSLLFNLSSDFDFVTTSITQYELLMGATDALKIKDVEFLLSGFEILPFGKKEAVESAKIYHELRKNNKMIEFRDIFISSICIVNNSEIMTLNKKHFQRILDLEIFKIS